MTSMPYEMLILAGGFGTRLRAVVNDVPKPMAPVAGRPFLEYLMDYWIGQGVSRFVLSLGYKGDLIQAHFGNSYNHAEISYIQESMPLGTGGAVRMALEEVLWNNAFILITNGDTWFEVDLPSLSSDAEHYVKPISMALKLMEDNNRYGGVAVENGLVTNFGVQEKDNCLINGGCYLIDVKFLSEFMRQLPESFSFEDEVLKPFAFNNQLAASMQNNVFLDIGIPEDYQKAAEVLSNYKFEKGRI
jgi:D-glycero-alpha-D-manno-heptose 1-phosphate guanylyltransferase